MENKEIYMELDRCLSWESHPFVINYNISDTDFTSKSIISLYEDYICKERIEDSYNYIVMRKGDKALVYDLVNKTTKALSDVTTKRLDKYIEDNLYAEPNTIIDDDLLAIKTGVIIHQVNNKHVMGAGIAKDIRALCPSHYTDYMRTNMVLGDIVKTRVSLSPFLGIVGMIAQDGYGRDDEYTKYGAFTHCLLKIRDMYNINTSIKYYVPAGIGCGLAGGNWRAIIQLLSIYCPFIIIVHKA